MLLDDIDAFLRGTRMPESHFGRISINDPNLVSDLREGRKPRPKTVARIRAYLEQHGPARPPDRE